LSLLTNLFDAALWGVQRFDLMNGIDILSALLRAGFTIYCIGEGGGLVALALITLGATGGSGVSKLVLAFRENRALRLSPQAISSQALRELFSYSRWNFVTTITRITRMQLAPILIAALLGVAMVTPYAIANRLAGCVAMVVGEILEV